jgi:tetratricopeptide (TPR) repeat protein
MKRKSVAGILALFFGIFGVHRFYLGRWFQGVLHFLLFFVTLGISIEENWPAVLAPALLGFVDAILFFAMPIDDFDDKYNAHRIRERMRRARYVEAEEAEDYEASQTKKSGRSPSLSFLKGLGIERFRAGDFDGAVDAFVKALEKGIEYPWLHFNLACCYSMIQDADAAMEHLEKAVANGFDDHDKIYKHASLQFLREQPAFGPFAANGFKRPRAPQDRPAPTAVAELTPLPPLNPLDQILQLGELKDKGLISEEEFQREKQKLLR